MRAWNGRSLHPFAIASDQLAGPARAAASFLIRPEQMLDVDLLHTPGHTVCGLPVFIRPEMSD